MVGCMDSFCILVMYFFNDVVSCWSVLVIRMTPDHFVDDSDSPVLQSPSAGVDETDFYFLLQRGKFSPRLKDLIQMNTPRLCITETKKAFRALAKKEDLASAIQALCNLKGVGPAMASSKYPNCISRVFVMARKLTKCAENKIHA